MALLRGLAPNRALDLIQLADQRHHLVGRGGILAPLGGPQQGRKVFTLQTLPACDPEEPFGDSVGKVAGFSLHAGVAAKARERKKL